MNSSLLINPNTLKIYQSLEECNEDLRLSFDILSTVSWITSFIVFLYKIRNPKLRHFPDNFVTANLGYASLFSFVVALSGFVDRKHLDDDATGFYQSVCSFQAFFFQLTTSLLVWHWIVVVIVMYDMIVQGTPVATIRKSRYIYFSIYLGISIGTSLILALFGKYGPVPEASVCWINDRGGWRFGFLYSNMMFGITLFFLCTPPVVKALWKANKAETNPYRKQIFQETMIQQLVYAAYSFIVFTIVMIYAINNFLLEIYDSAWDSTYIANTTYTYCSFNMVNLTTIGLFVSIIFAISYKSYAQMKALFSKCCVRSSFKRESTKYLSETRTSSIGSHERDMNQMIMQKNDSFRYSEDDGEFAMLETPDQLSNSNRSPRYLGELCNSAYDTKAETAVSVPPDEQQRQAHDVATNAYTNVLLNYVKEQLVLDGLDVRDSDLESYITDVENSRTTGTYAKASDSVSMGTGTNGTGTNGTNPRLTELEMDKRLAQAKERWLLEYNARVSRKRAGSQYN